MHIMGKEGKSLHHLGRLLIWPLLLALLFSVMLAGQVSASTSSPGQGITRDQTSIPQQALAPASCSKASPYGFTTMTVDQALVERYQELGVCWVRYQIHENDLRGSDGSYNWSKLDQAVALMDEAGIFMDVPLQCFSGPGSSCFGSNPYIPTPKEMTNFASQIASRYNGENGHGTIEAFEIGNEEYDQNTGVTIQEYADLLEAGYQAIKQAHPEAIVGMYGPFKVDLAHLEEVMTGLQDVSFDFLNVHYYGRGEDPSVSTKSHPSFKEVIETLQDLVPKKPLWVTEIGWATSCTNVKNCKSVTPQVQQEYLEVVMQQAQDAGVGKVFWFTLNYGNLGYSLYPKSGEPLPAYDAFAQMVNEQPVWGNADGQDGEGGGADSGGGNTLEPACESVMEQEKSSILITTTCSWTEHWEGQEEETISCSFASGQGNPDQGSKKSKTCKQEDLDQICEQAQASGFDLSFCYNKAKASTTFATEQENLSSPLFVAFRPHASSDLGPEPVLLAA